MKSIGITLILSFSLVSRIFSQNVGINATGAPADASAALDVNSTTSGFLPPRMTTAQRDAIASPANGLMIYNTDSNCYQYFDGTSWTACLGAPAPNLLGCGTDNVTAPPIVGYALTSSNTLTIDVAVNTIAPYTITTNTVNGYSYSASGVFPNTGSVTVTLVGSGTPIAAQTDNFTITMAGSSVTCTASVTVINMKPNCAALLAAGYTTDGKYTIDPDGTGGKPPFDCYCDMTTDGGGWTLVWSNIRDVTGKQETNMVWNTAINTAPLLRSGTSLNSALDQFQVYTGLSYWNTIAANGKLRYTWANTGTTVDQSFMADFSLSGAFYTLNLSNYVQLTGGTTAGLYSYHRGRPFTTVDADHDASGGNCGASYSNTPFWYGACWSGSINGGGEYSSGYYNGAYWTGSAGGGGTDAGQGGGNGWIWLK